MQRFYRIMISKTLIATFLALAVCMVADAATVYKWNENGKIIYSQTPPPPGIKFEVVISEDVGKSTSVAKAEPKYSNSSFEERRDARLQKKQEKEVLEESNRIKQENCKIAQNNMQSLTSRGQVTIKDGDIYRKLSEDERQGRIEDTQSQIEEFCQG